MNKTHLIGYIIVLAARTSRSFDYTINHQGIKELENTLNQGLENYRLNENNEVSQEDFILIENNILQFIQVWIREEDSQHRILSKESFEKAKKWIYDRFCPGFFPIC